MPGAGGRDATAILEAAKNAELKDVVILGWDKDDELFISGSFDEREHAFWLINVARDLFTADTIIPND